MRSTTKAVVKRARVLRRRMSPPEVLLWRLLRESPDGLKFRRQHPIGPFVVDFYCPATKLVVEVDGDVHDMGDNPEFDERRATWLGERGYPTLRVPAAEVFADPAEVAQAIISACRAIAPPPSA